MRAAYRGWGEVYIAQMAPLPTICKSHLRLNLLHTFDLNLLLKPKAFILIQ